MKSIFGTIQNMSATHKQARFLRASGWKGSYHRTGVQTGYHKQMPLADRRLLADRLQRQAAK